MSGAHRLRALCHITAVTWRADPLRATAAAALTVVRYASPALAAVAIRLLVSATADGEGATAGVLLLAATVAVDQAAGFAAFVVNVGLTERVAHRLDLEVMSLVAERPCVDHLEDPEALDRITLLTEGTSTLAGLTDAAITAGGVLARLAATLLLLATVDLRLVGLAACAVPSLAAGLLTERIRDRRDALRAPPMRRAAVLHHLVRTAGPASEIRLAGAQQDIAQRLHDDRREVDEIIARSNLAMAAVETGGWLAFGAGAVGTLLVVSDAARSGRASPGELAMVVALAAQLNGQVGALGDWLTGLLDVLRTASHLTWLRDLARGDGERDGQAPTGPCELVLRGVDFAYPGTHAGLRDVDLALPMGATIALVGENGSGKSTLVKLVTGMHRPTGGTITVGGAPLDGIAPAAWRRRLSAAFQDPAPFEVTVAEAVGLGELDRLDDRAAIAAAVAAAGADPLVASLPGGLEARLGRSFDDGTELSGGQRQRLAIARAAMRRTPEVLVLDEPSANLDPAAEDELFLRLLEARRMGSDERPVRTLLVTHRLSSAARADLIVVMADGRVIERGTHTELLAADGQYAALYRLQADGYR